MISISILYVVLLENVPNILLNCRKLVYLMKMEGVEAMYILGFIVALVSIGVLVDLRRGSFKSRQAHDTNPNHLQTPAAEQNALNSTSPEVPYP